MTPQEEVRRADAASRIIEDALFVEAKELLLKHLCQLRRQVSIGDSAMHTRLILMEQLAHEFFRSFEHTIQTGRMARMQWAQEERQRSLRAQAADMFRRLGRNAL